MSDDLLTVTGQLSTYIDSDFQKKVAILTFMTGKQVGRRVMLADDRITLGRSPEATIMLQDTHASRQHLAISYLPPLRGYHIQDLGSSNGTLLNENRVSEAILKDSDKIIIGTTLLRFSWADALDLRYQNEIDQLINIDELTGLVVKRRFDEELNRFVAVTKKQGNGLVLIMMDMDGIKQINDTYGHVFGAYAISETGKIIKSLVDQKGLASRFGGDEFMSFIPGVGLDTGGQLGEDIRRSVETHAYVKDGICLKPTISIGVSALNLEDTLETLLKRADDALYQSKRAGRNRVSLN
jgi:diguanylate cyclase (GGDEF)-like protein